MEERKQWLCLHSSATLLHDHSGWNSLNLLSIFSINFYDQYNFIDTNLKQYLYVHPEELWLYHFGRIIIVQFSSVQSLSRVRLLATPWIAASQACLSPTPGVHSDSQVLKKKKKKHWFGQNRVHNLTLEVINWIVKYINLFLWNNHLVCGWLDFSKFQLFQLSLQWKY